jgi:hypothetical protein
MNVVCAIPVVRIDKNFQIAIKSLFGLEYNKINYFLYFDHVRIENTNDLQAWVEFENFLFSSTRWKANNVTLVSGSKRAGLIGSWNNAARLAWGACQDPKLFFWGSDHDVWSPNFLDFPLDIFSQPNPPQLAVPQCGDLVGETSKAIPAARIDSGLNQFLGPFAPGYSIYGVFRYGTYPKLPNSLLPDRLFLSKFALRNVIAGQSSQEIGYFRRRVSGEEFSVERQIRNLWGGQPQSILRRRLPWWGSHLISITLFFTIELFKNPDKRLFTWYKQMVIDRTRRSKTLSKIYKMLR